MPSWRAVLISVLGVALLLDSNRLLAQRSVDSSDRAELPRLSPAPDPLPQGATVGRIEVLILGNLWQQPVTLSRVSVGDPLTPEVARRALSELTDSGRFASARAEVVRDGELFVLRLSALPRRLVAGVRLEGSQMGREETLTVAEVQSGMAVTAEDLPNIVDKLEQAHVLRGYPNAKARVNVVDTDDPDSVLLNIVVQAGNPAVIQSLGFSVVPESNRRRLVHLLSEYQVEVGQTADRLLLDEADEDLAERLRLAGFHAARVTHRLAHKGSAGSLIVDINAGPVTRFKFSRHDTFDATTLEEVLLDDRPDDYSPYAFKTKLVEFYQRRGFFDVEITTELRHSDDGALSELWFHIREGAALRVAERRFPCLTGPLSAEELNLELDGFLASELPGDAFLLPVDPKPVNSVLSPGAGRGVTPYRMQPWRYYVPDVYDKALEHLADIYRARGYLSVEVGPVSLVRGRCHNRTQPNVCRLAEPVKRPDFACSYDEVGLPIAEKASGHSECTSDSRQSLRCAPDAELVIPIKLGPLTRLYDIAFVGNHALVEQELLSVVELEPGTPLSLVEVERARQRLLDRYAEEAYAFADVDAELDLSFDHTRGRVRFEIAERAQVRVSRIEVEGSRRTQEGLIRRRIALEEGGLYRRSLVRRTEEQLATLGVFATVTVGFEDPYVPAREKVVLVTLTEKNFQYVDTRSGFSTGDGFRFTFEYGHRSIAGSAIQLTARAQLGILPTALIFEKDVRDKFEELSLIERLERRNSVAVEFPEIGLGPRFRLSVEGLDIRDNSRDFGITKDAALPTLMYRHSRQLSAQLGGSVELNDASIFGEEQKGALEAYVRNNPQLRNVFRVPEGTTLAFAQRIEVAWDRRDQALDPTTGTFMAGGVEHVNANPVESDEAAGTLGDAGVFAATPSDFMRYTSRVAGYLRFRDDGLSLAASFRWGLIQQLTDESRTYPDRLFFMGGFDTMRGFLQDSMVPEDIAERLLASAADPACNGQTPPDSCLTTNEVVIRGGDFFINPRLELRIPLGPTLRTAVFVDTGNLWTTTEYSVIRSLKLRYAAGAGLRVGTPVGPLVFDYGINVERLLDRLLPNRQNQRFWEDLGAFHFSIGVF